MILIKLFSFQVITLALNTSMTYFRLRVRKRILGYYCLFIAAVFLIHQLFFLIILNKENAVSNTEKRTGVLISTELSLVQNKVSKMMGKQNILPHPRARNKILNREDLSKMHSYYISAHKQNRILDLMKISKNDTKVKLNNTKHEQNNSVLKVLPITLKVPANTGELFTCLSTKMKISKSKLNDDYCDCPDDGSDEPLTSACENGSFECVRFDEQFPKSVASSFVNDGFCDCCDGSDEWRNNVICPKKCQDAKIVKKVRELL